MIWHAAIALQHKPFIVTLRASWFENSGFLCYKNIFVFHPGHRLQNRGNSQNFKKHFFPNTNIHFRFYVHEKERHRLFSGKWAVFPIITFSTSEHAVSRVLLQCRFFFRYWDCYTTNGLFQTSSQSSPTTAPTRVYPLSGNKIWHFLQHWLYYASADASYDWAESKLKYLHLWSLYKIFFSHVLCICSRHPFYFIHYKFWAISIKIL